MRLRQILTFALLTALCGAIWAGAAAARPAVVCKSGQTSTKAHPCTKPTTVKPTPQSQLVNIDPGDTEGRVGATDSYTIIRYLDPKAGLYQVEVDNTSGIGYINTFNWVPPPTMTISAITSTEGGRCHLSGGAIACTGGDKGLEPPSCTCSTGGKLVVNFTATGNAPTFNGQWWTYYGVVGSYTQITSMTPVPYHIPSFVPSVDLPLCAKGVTSTADKPCATK